MDTAPITKQPPPYSETVRPTLDDATGNNWQQDHHPQYPSAPPISSFSYMPLTPPPTTTHNVTVVTAAAPQIMGGCPACRIGTMEKDSTYTPVRENITNNQTKSFIPKDTSSRDKSHVPFLEMEYQSASSDVRFKIKRKYCEI
ncbi:unnamed protein product [Hermetia illucens]|uniref:Uncharacterized protein n=1 Tax=Hermetia illucens TaxID=343691 RepID=A0A7R8UR37_HERIL|nr:unnamed protein product [Hermetia illucens]